MANRVDGIWESIQETLKFYDDLRAKGRFFSGKDLSSYRLCAHNAFETSLAEKVVNNYLSARNNVESVGWEVPYPYSDRNIKLDLGFDPSDSDPPFFRIAVEIKKWVPKKLDVPFEVWEDIFRLHTYHGENEAGYLKNGEDSELSSRKYILLFMPKVAESRVHLEKAFISIEYLDTYLKGIHESELREQGLENLSEDLDFLRLSYFIKKDLKLEAISDMILGRIKRLPDRQILEIEKDSKGNEMYTESCESDAAALLRILEPEPR